MILMLVASRRIRFNWRKVFLMAANLGQEYRGWRLSSAQNGADDFTLVRFEASEGLSELFTYNIEAASKTENAVTSKAS